jgi:hypothetical protein
VVRCRADGITCLGLQKTAAETCPPSLDPAGFKRPQVACWHKCEVRDVRSLVAMRGNADVADIGVTASEFYMRQSETPCSRKSAVPRGIFG